MKTKTTYLSADWKEFNTEEECSSYEKTITPAKITHSTYLCADKWKVSEELREKWYQFDGEIMWSMKYILNEVKVTIEIDSKTGEYKILSCE